MTPESSTDRYFIWGADHAGYGPVELAMLADWIKDERVLPDTWVFTPLNGHWQRADALPELQSLFRVSNPFTETEANPPPGIRPGMLRRVKALANLNDPQLERFARFMELQRLTQWTVVVKQGDHGDAMYLILDGELRARLMVGETEKILATLGPGEFFGDMSLFDHGPRSADVVANVDSTVLKISAAGFEKLSREAPDLATPFLLATLRTLAARIRADNKRFRDSVNFASAAGL